MAHNRLGGFSPTKPIQIVLKVVITITVSVFIGGTVTGYWLDPVGFTVFEPWFLLFFSVALASSLFGAIGTALLLTSTR
jgi:hypothetical protein